MSKTYEDIIKEIHMDEVAHTVRSIGRVEAGITDRKSDSEHVEDERLTLAATRDHFGFEGDRHMHGVYREGSDVMLAKTGTGPNASAHADILAHLWNHLVKEVEDYDRARGEVRPKAGWRGA